MQVAEVKFLPEAAAEAVADPAGDGEHPQADGGSCQTQHTMISTAKAGKEKRFPDHNKCAACYITHHIFKLNLMHILCQNLSKIA